MYKERFLIAEDEEIKKGLTTDVYFLFTEEIIRKKNDIGVVMEIYTRSFPDGRNWGVVSGIYEVLKLLEGKPVNVRAMEEGTIFLSDPRTVAYEPVLQIEGRYSDFAKFENPVLGFLCSMSGVATRAARLRFIAEDRLLLSFGSRRAHPAIAPAIEWSAFIGGVDAVSNVIGAEFIGQKPAGTMPHSLILILGDQREAWKAFDEIVDKTVPRIALVDTLYDEKTEAIMAAETLGKNLYGIRMDTPGSRKGNWRRIIDEVRWELAVRGRSDIKIIVSGNVDDTVVNNLKDIVDGFGVGTYISNAPSVDFSGKVVELIYPNGERVPRAKRGDISGKKQVYRNWETFEDVVQLDRSKPLENYEPLLKVFMEKGKITKDLLSPKEIRERTLKQLNLLRNAQPKVTWKI
ncbi:MAG: nicotinate phosphoribosyltransferase [Thermoproteota archaeon]|nr:nicotinate phosphoribosyltransferase [Candidatus Brockarchaeota archaeon]MBO3762948.1 nicotinate phosphoribosyltransferase [Candidatus Brockarchaeota archaeon]MBO3768255.1 nicotinate phosphoribosyltransferase [Candidatus Brockarchaeota archaeon]MBO3802124.1 nicotinate phosphoribosyltransferase [Candidatus Brockarchaeota archaeon]